MNWRIRMKKRHALFVLVATCSAISYLFGFIAHAETVRGEEERFETGDTLEVETGLGDGYSTLGFTCLDTDYRGGYLFVSDEIIPYSLCVRYAASNNDYTYSDVRTWLNQQFADTLSVSGDLLPVKLSEAGDSISDRVFCLSVDEVKNTAYKAITRKIWTPQRGMRYYWTRSPRENTTNQAYMVQYNGHIASSRVSLTEAGVRPAFVIQKGEPDNTQGRIWYTGDTMERSIAGKSYTFRCIDPDYCDAGSNRNGALFLCDTIIGGSESLFDGRANAWEASDLRAWINQELEDREKLAETVTTCPFTYAGKSNNYQISARRFTKRSRPGIKVTDQIFCLSLEEALRYPDILWRLGGAEENNFINAGTFTAGYWLRTPAAGDGTKGYAVTYDGRVAPEDITNKKIGIRPAFVVVQK